MRERRLVRLLVQGISPERLLLKIRRLRIPIYNVKKVSATKLLLSVKTKDEKKVLALENSVYKIAAVYKDERLKNLLKRTGLWIGIACFLALTLLSGSFCLSVNVVGAEGLEHEIKEVLTEEKVKPFSRFPKDTNRLSARILGVDGVAFCSVKRLGTTLLIEVVTSPFQKAKQESGDMKAEVFGELTELCVLSGTSQKKIGEKVSAGETLVCGYVIAGETKTEVFVRAFARIRVRVQITVRAQSPAVAFAKACFEEFGGFLPSEEIEEKSVQETTDGYLVTIVYTAVQSMNF